MDKKKAQNLGDIVQTLLPAEPHDILELDELWSFVWSKQYKAWVWIALCRRSRQIVSYFVGNRDADTCQKFWDLIPKTTKSQSFTLIFGKPTPK